MFTIARTALRNARANGGMVEVVRNDGKVFIGYVDQRNTKAVIVRLPAQYVTATIVA